MLYLKPCLIKERSSEGKNSDVLLAGSVFDLVPEKDKGKMEAVKKMPAARPSGSVPSIVEDSEKNSATALTRRPMSEESNVEQQRPQGPMFRGGTGGFKPFLNNPEKQKRYEHYLELRKQGKKCKSAQQVQTQEIVIFSLNASRKWNHCFL